MKRKTNDGMTLRVNVTLFDIHEGNHDCGRSCPIAIALLRTLRRTFRGPEVRVFVNRKSMYISNNSGIDLVRLAMPKLGAQFVRRFDLSEDLLRWQRLRGRIGPMTITLRLTAKQADRIRNAPAQKEVA